MNKSKLSVLNISLLGAALSLGAVGTASAASAGVKGLEVGGHLNYLMADNVFDDEDTEAFGKYKANLMSLSGFVAYAVPINAQFDIVPELNLGFGINKHEKKINYRFLAAKLDVKTTLLLKTGVKFRFNANDKFNLYAGPEFVLHKYKSTATITGLGSNSETDKTSKPALMLGGGFAVTPNVVLDLRTDFYDGAVNIAGGAIYKF